MKTIMHQVYEIRDQLWKNVQEQVENAINAKVHVEVQSFFDRQCRNPIYTQTWGHVGQQVRNQVYGRQSEFPINLNRLI